MNVKLTSEQEAWLRGQVAAGRFASFDDAVAEAIDGLRQEEGAMDWAKPLVEQGLAELDRGDSLSADEVFSRIDERLRAKL